MSLEPDRRGDVHLAAEPVRHRLAHDVGRERGPRQLDDDVLEPEHALGRGLRGRGLDDAVTGARGRRSGAPRAPPARPQCRSAPCSTAGARGRAAPWPGRGRAAVDGGDGARGRLARDRGGAACTRHRARRQRAVTRRPTTRSSRRARRPPRSRRRGSSGSPRVVGERDPVGRGLRGRPQQLGVGPRGSLVGRHAVRAVHRDHEMVAGTRRRDVEQAQLLVEAHLLVDGLVTVVLVGGDLRRHRERVAVGVVGEEELHPGAPVHAPSWSCPRRS